jgi:hypothetical protein
MRFHYLPFTGVNARMNVDSAEYANIVLTFTRFYDQARRAGMPALPAASRELMSQWIQRVVSGYWTHSGYMNWDSGLGFQRWHQAKKLGLTQEALVALASSDTLLPSPQWGAWAKTMLDRGLEFYDRLATRAGGVPDPVLFDVSKVPQGPGSARLALARIEANAARAVDAGLGARAAAEPPPLYAYDPDIGRLAVTTPTYNTAIVAVNQHAFPYGGLDLARLFDGEQEVAANIGGRPPASFGLLVRDVAAADESAARGGRDLVRRPRPRVRRTVHGPARDGHRVLPDTRHARLASLHARLDRDELARDPARGDRAVLGRRALPLVGREGGEDRGRAARRDTGGRRRPADRPREACLPLRSQ